MMRESREVLKAGCSRARSPLLSSPVMAVLSALGRQPVLGWLLTRAAVAAAALSGVTAPPKDARCLESGSGPGGRGARPESSGASVDRLAGDCWEPGTWGGSR